MSHLYTDDAADVYIQRNGHMNTAYDYAVKY